MLYSSEIWNSTRYLTNSFPKDVQNLPRVISNSSPTRVSVSGEPQPSVLMNKVLRTIFKPKKMKEEEEEAEDN